MGRSNSACHVAVLGGGLQGCCIALALAERGARVTLYDRNDALMTRAAAVNEGRMHLGYVYAADTTLATARMMIRGALAFVPFLERLVGMAPDQLALSPRTTYVVHRDSQRPADAVAGYFAAVHVLVDEAVGGRKDVYFGLETPIAPRRWSAAKRDGVFDPSLVVAAFDTSEIAIDPLVLARAVRQRIAATPRIETRLQCTVQAVGEHRTRLRVVAEAVDGALAGDTYDHVVNAAWDGRLAIDATRGLRPSRPWIYRFKYGLRFRAPHARTLPTVTIGLGPYGDLVVYDNSTVYLSWYPSCLEGVSQAVSPPAWPRMPAEPRRARLVADSLQGMAEIVIPLRNLAPARLRDCSVQGGVIVAWGCTDIDDPTSELHHRYEIGVASNGNYHSVDPGKLTMAPYFAGVCVDRIVPR